MNELRLHPNMLLGVSLPSARPGAAGEQELRMLRRLGVKTCMIDCAWEELEPDKGVFDPAAVEALREELIRLRTLDVEPLLCLWRGREPRWFRLSGGWQREDSIRLFLRYAEHLVGAVGHLAAEYITFAEPNEWLSGPRQSREQALSAVAGAHLRGYRLIHELRRAAGFRDTAVGFCLHMRPAAQAPLTALSGGGLRLYQQLPLRAMALGEFNLPLRNLTRMPRGTYCDFLGFSYGAQRGRGWRRERDDMGREIRPEGLSECCSELLRTAARPLYYLDRGAVDRDDSFRARYIYEHLEAICRAHEPVLRYYYGGLLDGEEGAAGPRGLFSRPEAGGPPAIKDSGRFYGELIRCGGVTDELYEEYVAGQAYRR